MLIRFQSMGHEVIFGDNFATNVTKLTCFTILFTVFWTKKIVNQVFRMVLFKYLPNTLTFFILFDIKIR